MSDFAFNPIQQFNWQAPALHSGRFVVAGTGFGTFSDAVDPVENRLYLTPFTIRQTMTFDRLGFGIITTAAGDASCQARVGVYRVDPVQWMKTSPVKVTDHLITSALDTTGDKHTDAISLTLPPAAYLFATIINKGGGGGAMPRPTTLVRSDVGAGNAFFGLGGSSPSSAASAVITNIYKDETIADWSTYVMPSTLTSWTYSAVSSSGCPVGALRVA